MPTVLVTGASRGIGLEFCRQYAAQGWKVLAACRNPAGAADLNKLTGDVSLFALDVDDDASIGQLAERLKGVPIDVLINNAGISGRPAGTFGSIDSAVFMQVLRTNTVAPVMVAEAFADNVAASKERKLVAITSRLGSIQLNDGGGMYGYRASKAALNAAWKSLSLDLKARNVICAVFHPGWVQTDMGGKNAAVTPQDSVAGMIKIIGGLKPADNGKFYNYDGAALAW
jgi:NAD(P)-dependent dehydrogenase (short-subunit alcohol dehydrogenase family)